MPYLHVWIIIGISQIALVGCAVAFWLISRSQCMLGFEDGSGGSPADIARAERACHSRFWWVRLRGARVLASVATERHRELLQRLLMDRHPAVQTAATECLRRYADAGLIALVLDALYQRARLVWAHQLGILELYRGMTIPLLLERLQRYVQSESSGGNSALRHTEADSELLKAYVRVAEQLQDNACLECVAELSVHPHTEVRVTVARVLGRCPQLGNGETALIKLLVLLRDPAWMVRAQAARSLGLLQDERAISSLLRAIEDSSWWVRFRSATALATSGTKGREALERAASLSDRFARDMAAFVRSLSPESIAYMAEDH